MNATEPATAPSPIPPGAESQSREGRTFLIISLASLLLAMGILVGQPGILLTSILSRYERAWMDLMIYGCAFSGVFGLCYRALPEVFGVSLFSRRGVWIHLAFHLAGILLILGDQLGTGVVSAFGGPLLIAIGALLFALNIGLTLNRISQPDASTAFLGTSLLWLLMVVAVGVPFASESPFSLFKTEGWSAGWIVLALVGVVLNTAFGLTLRTLPRRLGCEESISPAAWQAFGFTNVGLAWLSTALALAPLPAVMICALVYLIGALVFLALLTGMVQKRTSPLLDWDVKILLLAVSLIFVPVALLFCAAGQRMVAAASAAKAAEAAIAAGESVVETVLHGGFLPVDKAIVLTVLLAIAVPALLALIFQFLALETAAIAKKSDSDFRHHLGSQILLSSFFNYAVGVMMIIPAAWAGIERIVGLGTLFLLVGAAGFLGNYFYLGGPPSAKRSELPEGPVTAS